MCTSFLTFSLPLQSTALRQKAAALEQTVARLQEQCTLYQDTLESSLTNTTSIAKTTRPLTSSCGSSSHCSSSLSADTEASVNMQPVDVAPSTAHTRPRTDSIVDPVEKKSASVQTYSTSLGLCFQCAESNDNLIRTSEVISDLCSRLKVDSSIPGGSQLSQASSGVSSLWHGRLTAAIRADVLTVGETFLQLRKQLETCLTELASQKEKTAALKERCSVLDQQTIKLQADIEEAEKDGRMMVEKCNMEHKEQLKVVRFLAPSVPSHTYLLIHTSS